VTPSHDASSHWRPETRAVALGRPSAPGDPLNAPLVPASTFHAGGDRGYAREGNPGWDGLERVVGDLEGGHAISFASGLAASDAVFSLVPPGGVVVAPNSPYHGVTAQLQAAAARGGIELRTVDFTDLDAAKKAMDDAHLAWIETPSNPMLDVVDIAAVVGLAQGSHALVAVDNTLATPLVQRPLQLGADLVVHSATKFLGGHSDLILGLAIARDPGRAQQLSVHRHRQGAIPGTLEAYLALRGLRTLAVRLDRAQQTAADLAHRLEGHPSIARVRYPGLPSHPGHQLASQQMSGFGAMVSFETRGTPEATEVMCADMKLITHATSLGGVETLIERRARYEGDRVQGVPDTLIRMSVGLEHVEDLWEDLKDGLERIDTAV